jgi:CoA:oxalate CoA-transferase
MSGPLEGIRVLDLSWVLAGPFCTMILGDLGAEVIKLERTNVGDLARGNGPFINGESSYFISINRGKKSITVDLQKPEGKQLFLRLVKKVDIIVENFVPGTLKRLGVDYDVVKKENPGIIFASISGFGQTGPDSQNRALDVIIQAMGGLMSITGEKNGPPIKPGASVGDITAGLFTTIGILSALHEREKSGQGQMIDISMLDCQMAILENAFMRYFATGEIPERLGTRHAVYTPFQAFETKDGYIVIAMVGGARNQWPLFCAVIGHLELMDDPRYQTGAERTAHYNELEPILNEVIKTKTTDEWLKELSEVGIPCGPINNIKQVAESPYAGYRNMIVDIPRPGKGIFKLINTPIKLSRTPGRVDRLAPELGENTRDVLSDLLDISEDELDKLSESGII